MAHSRIAITILLMLCVQSPAGAQTCVGWEQRFPAQKPGARAETAMVFDSARGVSVLTDAPTGSSSGTWEWDGTDWLLRTTSGPMRRFGHAAAFDSRRGKTVLFGGRQIGGDRDDTWEWDGQQWVQVPVRGPPARCRHAMVYDAARGVTILFGGDTEDPNHNPVAFGDTWEWDGQEWRDRAVQGPTARSAHGMAYDSRRRVVVLFGGGSLTSILGDTWEWDGQTWTQRATTGPDARAKHVMVYDERRGVVVLFGGTRLNLGLNDTWEWDGVQWTERISPTRPRSRMAHAMAYDSARERIVLFGGRNHSETFDDTWEFVCDPPCYPDCDPNGVLDIFDFLCFQNSFVSGEPYACGCDPDPACNLFDFLCFQNAFVAGCP